EDHQHDEHDAYGPKPRSDHAWEILRPRHVGPPLSRPASRSVGMPPLLVLPLRFGVAAVEKHVVVAKVEMVGLQPDAGHVDGVAMGGKSAVPLVDVGANVLHAGDHLFLVVRHFLEIARSAILAENSVEIGRIVVGAPLTVFGIHDGLYGI